MPKAKNQELTKKTLNLRTGDFEKMGDLFPQKGFINGFHKVDNIKYANNQS